MEIPGYKIKDKIAQGGMATVYLAEQESLQRTVVLKILSTNNPNIQQSLVERFIVEARILATLNHRHIITIFDIGTSDDLLYISMEYVSGGDLKARLNTPIKPDTALDHICKISSGLDVIHKKGIIHRDIKPANIMFRDDNTPLIADFGIAKQIGEFNNDLTQSGIFLGSPNYVSPEQAKGTDIDGRTDIYSLGCVFYEMLSGKKPYYADSVLEVIIKHKQDPIPSLENDLKEFQPLLNNMMAKDREQRFRDAAALATSAQKLSLSRKAAAASPDGGSVDNKTGKYRPQIKNILLLLVMTSGGILGTLQYAISNINSESVAFGNIPANAELLEPGASDIADAAKTKSLQAGDSLITTSDEIIQALYWLGKKSLEEYRLTYPPEDNAYYYYSRLLEEDPKNEAAIKGLYDIAERYAALAERAALSNEYSKARVYINIGLKFDSNHKTLQDLNELISNQ